MGEYNTKNYTEQGGEVTHIGGSLIFDEGGKLEGGLMPNQVATSGSSGGAAVTAVNALLKKLKNAGLMVADSWDTPTVTKDLNDTSPEHADRQANTDDISSVTVADGVITITLSKKVSALKDFDGQHGWGIHKWLGIGIKPWSDAITGIYYNDTQLTAEDVSEAQSVGLTDAGYFVRWVAADLVLAGDNTQKSKDTFTLWADGYEKVTYKLAIVEPAS